MINFIKNNLQNYYDKYFKRFERNLKKSKNI